jgi:hypothetical protein
MESLSIAMIEVISLLKRCALGCGNMCGSTLNRSERFVTCLCSRQTDLLVRNSSSLPWTTLFLNCQIFSLKVHKNRITDDVHFSIVAVCWVWEKAFLGRFKVQKASRQWRDIWPRTNASRPSTSWVVHASLRGKSAGNLEPLVGDIGLIPEFHSLRAKIICSVSSLGVVGHKLFSRDFKHLVKWVFADEWQHW